MTFRPDRGLNLRNGGKEGRMTGMTERHMPRSRTTVVLLAGAVAAWAVTIERMRGMDAGPGTDLGGLGWYLGIWVTMMAAMMLPSTAPAARNVGRRSTQVPTLLFIAGYLIVWTAYGAIAYAIYRLVGSLDIAQLSWNRHGPYAAGGVIVAAGLYELTPLKRRCLSRCRTAQPGGALRSGLEHGRDCVGCSGALMAVLFVLGVMSLVWMAVVAVVIFAEKVLPTGGRLVPVVAVALVVLGLWVAVSPATVPGLTEPADMPSMQMGG
jgi:predicted metal-binding membrane protein